MPTTIKPKAKKEDGMFMKAFKAMFGVFAASLLYWLMILFVLLVFIFCVYRIYHLRQCKQEPDGTFKETGDVDKDGNPIRKENTKTVCQKASDHDSANQAAIYLYYIIAVISGLILLVVFLPYIIQGIAWSIGSSIGDNMF